MDQGIAKRISAEPPHRQPSGGEPRRHKRGLKNVPEKWPRSLSRPDPPLIFITIPAFWPVAVFCRSLKGGGLQIRGRHPIVTPIGEIFN